MTDVIDTDASTDVDPAELLEPVRRELVVPFEFRADETRDGLTLAGYAAVFNSRTTIADWDGEYDEQIAPGAFKKTLRERMPVLQFDHGHHPLVGSIPIGAIRKLQEDKTGLYVEAGLFDNWMTQPVRDAIREQAISGMSFRFSVVKDTKTIEGRKTLRTLNEVRLFELGPVVFPAYADTSVALRSLFRHMPDLTALLGTPNEAVSDTSDEAAANAEPAPSHSRTHNQRRAVALLALRKGTPHD